ncbi:hypothetical protein GCM10009535_58930 [Streptomyces thermocarboxydovorans]|uniref:Metalloprotease TldD/E C-terminal domain-containing protein n=1 Tax=Streptomyces thermocarboxydovorans TaxID=59298 RepID=A0ABN1HXT5_9ACTN
MPHSIDEAFTALPLRSLADAVDASLLTVHENKFYADTAGTVTTQQRVRLHPVFTAVSVDESSGEFESMRTLAPPVGRGWEYLRGTGWDWDDELARIPELLAEKMRAPSVEPGLYDLVIDPSNLWLTIHESIGHATELDRALGYEAAYAGTSFATFDQLGKLRYGSELMNVTGDRTAEHGLATIGYDDEGVEAQSWDLVKDGVLVGYQLDRRIARLTGFERSNGCAYADSPAHVPVQRMANVSLQPDPAGMSTEDLIGSVDRGIYGVGDRSWSIDMQRYNVYHIDQKPATCTNTDGRRPISAQTQYRCIGYAASSSSRDTRRGASILPRNDVRSPASCSPRASDPRLKALVVRCPYTCSVVRVSRCPIH